MTDGLALLLALAVLAAFPLLIWVIRRIQEESWKERAGLGNLGALSDAQFDEWVESLFTNLGYRVEQARGRESLGVDWILTDRHGHRTALQTRRWRQDVGPEAIDQIVGGAVFHRCDERLVITTAAFTGEARRVGRHTETRLWSIRELAAAVGSSRREREVSPLAHEPAERIVPEGAVKVAPTAETTAERAVDQVAAATQPEGGLRCPRCGKAMIRRSVNGRAVMVCIEFPRCTGARVES